MQLSSVKSWFWVHKWTSLVCTLFMLMLCVTGLPLIFAHEIDHALGHTIEAPPLVGAVEQKADIDGIMADAEARMPGHVAQFIVRDPDEPELIFVRLGKTIDDIEASAFYTYDGRTGAFLKDYPLDEGIMNVLLRLHIDMFMGLPGTLFLGCMGLLLVASLVSGVVLYGPYMRKLQFGTVRRARSSRIKWLDLHNLLGIVTFVWLLVVGVTGVVNTLSAPIFGRWQSTELAKMTAPYRDGQTEERSSRLEGGATGRALAVAEAVSPDLRLSFMALPGNPFAGSAHYVAFMQGTTPWTSKLLTPLLLDGRTGQLLERGRMPWYVSALLVSQPLHFGDYGGLPLKILWTMLDMISIFVLVSGLYLWIKRRHTSFEVWLQSNLGLGENIVRVR